MVRAGFALDQLQGNDGGGGGEGAAGKFANPMAPGIALGKQGFAGRIQCSRQSGGVEAHSLVAEGLRFSRKKFCSMDRQSASITLGVIWLW